MHYIPDGFPTGGLGIRAGNACNSNPCLNGGSCVSQGSSFYCHCPPGYLGDTCNNGKIVPPSTVTVSLDTQDTPATMVRLFLLLLLLSPWMLRTHLQQW